MWYVASAIYATRLKKDPLNCTFGEERMYLVEGRDPNEAWDKAISFAKNEGGGSGFELDGEAATEEFMGIRKLISIRSHLSDPDMSSDNPRAGTELTFSFFRFNGETDLTNLVEGEAVRVVYEADARWE